MSLNNTVVFRRRHLLQEQQQQHQHQQQRHSVLLGHSQKWCSSTEHRSNTTTTKPVPVEPFAGASGNATHLTERLQDVLVFELHQDGNRRYMTLSVRSLYRYVLTAITENREYVQTFINNQNNTKRQPPIIDKPDTIRLRKTTVENQPLHQPATEPSATEDTEHVVVEEPNSGNSNAIYQDNNNNNNPSSSVNVMRRSKTYKNTTKTSTEAPVTYRERLGAYLHPRE